MVSTRPGARRDRWSRATALVVAAACVAVACTDDEAATPTTVIGEAVVDPEPADDPVDERLRIGVILPLTGTGSELGAAMSEAVERARDDMGDLGVNDRSVEVVVVDESTFEGAIAPFDSIFPGEIDAVIGPASSVLAERLVPVLVDAGVLTCSPTASAISLELLPDSGPLFVRTIPSDSMQAVALARRIDETGTSIVLAHVDDDYGERFAEAVQRELATQGAPTPEVVAFDPDDPDFGDVAARIVDTGAPTIGIVGDPESGPRLVQALAEVIDPLVQTSIWMNDAMRVPATANAYRRLDPDVLSIMRGVSPRSSVTVPGVDGAAVDDLTLFGVNAYDCFNVIALAAEQAPRIDSDSMADLIVPTTAGGTSCSTYRACVEQLRAGRGIDYDGPSGELQIERDGDLAVGLFDVYRFEDGLDVTERTTAVRVVR